MGEVGLKHLSSAQLFKLCSDRYHDDLYWEEFVRRYNQTLVRGVYISSRRFGKQAQLTKEVISDLLQDIYVEILKDRCASLQRFRGRTELEAHAFLVSLSVNITSNHLRRNTAKKRRGLIDNLEDLFQSEDDFQRLSTSSSDYTDLLADRELIEQLKYKLSGANANRDILMYLLHIREGLTITEIAESGICDLRPSSVAHIIRRIRVELKKIYFSQY